MDAIGGEMEAILDLYRENKITAPVIHSIWPYKDVSLVLTIACDSFVGAFGDNGL